MPQTDHAAPTAFDATVPPAAALQRLREARHLVVLTGAGISAESGIPTFRDALTGLWARFDPEQLATREGFLADPRFADPFSGPASAAATASATGARHAH